MQTNFKASNSKTSCVSQRQKEIFVNFRLFRIMLPELTTLWGGGLLCVVLKVRFGGGRLSRSRGGNVWLKNRGNSRLQMHIHPLV